MKRVSEYGKDQYSETQTISIIKITPHLKKEQRPKAASNPVTFLQIQHKVALLVSKIQIPKYRLHQTRLR